jgi:hypothetical protein
MAVTHEELQAFHHYATRKLNNGGAASIVELAANWEAARAEFDAAVDDVRQGLIDDAAGRGEPVAAVFAELRKELEQLS